MTNSARKTEKYPELYAYRLFGGENGVKIVSALMDRGMGFNELMRTTEISTAKTLSSALKRLISNNVVRKEIRSLNPPSAIYLLTDLGNELGRLLITMKEFGDLLEQDSMQ